MHHAYIVYNINSQKWKYKGFNHISCKANKFSHNVKHIKY
ncbi:hypothetical protein CIT292_08864 [Citrobacter youngae ATCC 29220]|uniref:Uncharacterized protein n=1 Tax=Citrobacter youngae ATCC 29220 TaxID=500640 RepID=D4BED1_9ENTR|nr:hypothetical protein CIT292_08864 [Citrobacter youngae ATCC 29220]